MIPTAMTPDRFNRFFFAARYLQALCPQGFNCRSILDLGSSENILADFLDGHPVIQIDQDRNKPGGFFIQSLAEKTPFRDQSFDFTVCLDVLEHTPVSNRSVILREIARITSATAIIAFPVNHPHNTSNEKNLSAIHLALTNQSNRFLAEHKAYGLVDWRSVLSHLSTHFPFTAVFHTFPCPLWLTAHLIDYFLGMLPETQPIRNSLFRCINHLPIISDDDSKAYRTFIVASHTVLPGFDNNSLAIPDEDFSDPDLVEAIRKSHAAIVSLNDYAVRLENTIRETSARYSALESHFFDTQTDLDNHRLLNRNLELYTTDLKSEITRIRQELKIATSELKSDISRIGQELEKSQKSLQELLKEYDKVEAYAIHLENNIMAKDRMITDLQARTSRYIKQLCNGK